MPSWSLAGWSVCFLLCQFVFLVLSALASKGVRSKKSTEVSREYGHRKVWQHGLEVAIKIKGSQGNRRVEWLKPEHPYTAISDKCDVHANHNGEE